MEINKSIHLKKLLMKYKSVLCNLYAIKLPKKEMAQKKRELYELARSMFYFHYFGFPKNKIFACCF